MGNCSQKKPFKIKSNCILYRFVLSLLQERYEKRYFDYITLYWRQLLKISYKLTIFHFKTIVCLYTI
jgi:hypothetical protein